MQLATNLKKREAAGAKHRMRIAIEINFAMWGMIIGGALKALSICAVL
jgi:hypothetical protein